MSNKILFNIILFLGLSYHVRAQYLDQAGRSLIEKNIISYHIRNAVEADIPIGNNGILSDYGKPVFQRLMPENGKLNCSIEPYKGKIEYPDSDYQLYEVKLLGFRYDLTDGTSYSVRLLGFLFDENYLIAFNPKTSALKYISGNFFKSGIAERFSLNKNDISTFNNYLMLRCHYMLPESIHYDKQDTSGIYFIVHSNVVNKDITVFISHSDYESVKIIDYRRGMVN
ncbi:MAG TPA: hypothetical protein VM802_18195 [Chitinophaga sp.]|uniref:hypothetical protein n=1 Tax=Chitinophaga sp. TaxID=1869181 RepID=UPI002C4CFC1F|nr:hypothetical protein [Chitinophaga sp.]HVI46816.1 hypothetical protein [Chitinophaga sp.]